METKNEITKQPRRPLVKIEELYADIEKAAAQNELNRLLNCPPKKEWIREHEGRQYIPIGIIEYLLTSIFQEYEVQIKEVKQIVNAVVVVVRVGVLDPITGSWKWNEGVGAQDIKTKSGKTPMEFDYIIYGAVMTGAPAAESYAIKDAVEKFGKLFGKDLNRKDENVMNYSALDSKFLSNEVPEELKMIIEAAEDKESLDQLYTGYPQYHSNPEFFKLITAKKQTL